MEELDEIWNLVMEAKDRLWLLIEDAEGDVRREAERAPPG
jgi:hypothetical protein